MDTNNRILRAELRAAATQNGMIRPEASMALPTAGVTLDASDNLQVPEGYWDRAKTAFPELFRAEPLPSTSSTHRAPAPAPTNQRRAADMSEAERRAWKIANGISVPHRFGR